MNAGRLVGIAMVAVVLPNVARAQPTPSPVEQLDFDRPEAWAMKYFISTTTLSGLEMPFRPQPGSISVGLEGGWIPTLSASQQRVGINGTAPQDLNKAPVMMRPRLTVGLPGRLSVTLAGTPPVRTFDVTPRLFAAALEWTALQDAVWRVSVRGHGQLGTVTGAFTCPTSVLSFAPGSAGNPTGCDSESSDVATLRYAGAELGVARRIRRWKGVTPHVAAGVNFVDSVYQLNDVAFGKPDRTRLETSGVMASASAGLGFELTRRVGIAADAFYAPLTVRRAAGAPRTMDSLLNARLLLAYRIRQ